MADTAQKTRRIRYHLGRDGTTARASEDVDNPLSQNFVDLQERDERAKARWWALHGRRFNRPLNGEMDG